MSVTIKQIAHRAGLSVPTVSRILNNDSELFRPETREKVLQAARELGYRPNSYRMALRTKRFNAIGLLVGPGQSTRDSLLRPLLTELHTRNQHLLVGQLADDAELSEASAPKMLREWSVDGMLMHCGPTPPAIVEKLIRDNKIPAIWFNRRGEADCIYPDDDAGTHDAVERLLRLGHRKVAFVSLAGEETPAGRVGFDAAMKDGGADAIHHVPPDAVGPAEALDHFAQWLGTSRKNAATAAVCAGPREAVALFCAALSVGLSVPADLSIIALADGPVDDAGRRITTMCRPVSEMALQGLAALSEKIANPGTGTGSRPLPLGYCEGTTLTPPGGA